MHFSYIVLLNVPSVLRQREDKASPKILSALTSINFLNRQKINFQKINLQRKGLYLCLLGAT